MDKSLLGLRLPSGMKTRNRFPCLLPEEGRESWSLIWGDGSGHRGGLGGLPTPLVVLCAGSCTGLCFCSDTSIVAIGFVIFCVLLFIYLFIYLFIAIYLFCVLPQLHRRGFIFSPFKFLCSVTWRDVCPGAGVAAKGPRSLGPAHLRQKEHTGFRKNWVGGRMADADWLTEDGWRHIGSAVSSSWCPNNILWGSESKSLSKETYINNIK